MDKIRLESEPILASIKNAVEREISNSIDREIETKLNDFKNELISQKDNYISEIMKCIRIYHEYNAEHLVHDYRIMFINKYEIK